MGDNLGLLIRKEQYKSMKRDIPLNHRGYIYLLRACCSYNGNTYDLDVGYNIACGAEGISDGQTTELDAMVLRLIREDHGVRVVPFFRASGPEKSANLSEFEALSRRTEKIAANDATKLLHFLFMDDKLGRVYEREFVDGMVAYNAKAVEVIEGLDEDELRLIEKKKTDLKTLGINV